MIIDGTSTHGASSLPTNVTSTNSFDRERRAYDFLETAPRDKKLEFSKYVILVRRVFDSKDNFQKRDIEIKGPLLQKALLDLNENGYPLNFDKPPPKV